MRLSEIDYTAGIGQLAITPDKLLQDSTVVGDFDNIDVRLYEDNTGQIYFVNETDMFGVIVLDGDRLRGVANYTNTPGLITMLVGFVTHRLNRKIRIDKTEQLTSAGITWLCKLLRAKGRGLTITDQNGDFPDADQVYAEWEHQMTQPGCGPTNIFIESKMVRHLHTKEQHLSEGSFFYYCWFIGDENIL
jgi:hypothetical protein